MYVLHVIVIWSLLINCMDDRRQGCCSSRCYQNELYVMIVRVKLNVHRHCSNIGSIGKAKGILFSLPLSFLSLSFSRLPPAEYTSGHCVCSFAYSLLFSFESIFIQSVTDRAPMCRRWPLSTSIFLLSHRRKHPHRHRWPCPLPARSLSSSQVVW